MTDGPTTDGAITDRLLQQIEQVKQTILASYPEARFKFTGSEHSDIFHLSVYYGAGNLQIPVAVARDLNLIWQNDRLTVITVVYPASYYKEEN